jgi:hypothetical protein
MKKGTKGMERGFTVVWWGSPWPSIQGGHTGPPLQENCRLSANQDEISLRVTLPLGRGQLLGRAGGELPGGPGLLIQQSQDILEDLPVQVPLGALAG